jgi:hypothetical protein
MTSSFCITSIVNTSVSDNKGTGVSIKAGTNAGGPVTATLDRVLFKNNGVNGFTADSTGGGSIRATISDSTFNFNGAIGVSAIGGPGGAVLIALMRDVVSNHPVDAHADGSVGLATITFQSCVLSTSSNFLESVGGGNLVSVGGNLLFDGFGGFTLTESPK